MWRFTSAISPPLESFYNRYEIFPCLMQCFRFCFFSFDIMRTIDSIMCFPSSTGVKLISVVIQLPFSYYCIPNLFIQQTESYIFELIISVTCRSKCRISWFEPHASFIFFEIKTCSIICDLDNTWQPDKYTVIVLWVSFFKEII